MNLTIKFSALQLLLGLSFLLHSCTETIDPPPPSTNVIQLSLQEASYSKAFLKITLPDTLTPRSVVLKRNGTVVASLLMQKRDTIIVDSNLVPKTTYTYLALRLRDTTAIEQSQPLQVTTRLKSPRDFSWTVDTLAYPGSMQTLMRKIYATSPENVYLVGANERGYGKMYHYDGRTWEPVKLSNLEGGYISGAIDLWSIYGFRQDNIYAVGSKLELNQHPPPNILDSSFIMHYDGTEWREVMLPKKGRTVESIWGADPNDIWAGGTEGAFYHYDGVSWKYMPFDSSIAVWDIFGFSRNEVYAILFKKIDLVQPDDSMKIFFYHYDGNTWSAKDSSYLYFAQRFGHAKLWGNSSSNLFSSGLGIFQSRGASWERIFHPGIVMLAMHGRTENDILVAGTESRIFHFDGESWMELKTPKNSNVIFFTLWYSDSAAFIIGQDGGKTYIYTGK